MDRLPTAQELKFRREYKTLYLRLSTVIRSLSTKFEVGYHAERVRECAEHLQPELVTILHLGSKGRYSEQPLQISCIIVEITIVAEKFWRFAFGRKGGKWATKAVDRGISRLEYLRDNWEDLTIVGDAVRGYELVRQSTES